MTNTQQDDAVTAALREIAAPQRELIAVLRTMEATFKQEREFILQHHPEEDIGEFPSLDGIETMNFRDLDVRKIFCELALRHVERRANEVQQEVDEAERIRDEQNMTEQQAWRKSVERSVAYLATEVNKLKGVQLGRLPALPHVARENIPQLLGQPGGMGRPAAVAPGAGGGVRLVQRGGDTSGAGAAPSTIEQGFTRRQHPLDVIGSSGRRG